jgi:hypothetical protein
MAPATVRMVLIEGENADGVTVEQDNFEVAARPRGLGTSCYQGRSGGGSGDCRDHRYPRGRG